MRRVSEIICESIKACCMMGLSERDKMSHPDSQRFKTLDFITRKNNEIRHETWGELEKVIVEIISEKKYDWKDLKSKDWDGLRGFYGDLM